MPWPGDELTCWRTLYVRDIRHGQARGWRAVGEVCLKCHAVDLDPKRLPVAIVALPLYLIINAGPVGPPAEC